MKDVCHSPQFANCVKVSVVFDSATPWTVAHQAPLSMGCSRKECWRGLPFPSPGDLPHPGIEPASPAWQADSLLSEPPGKPPQFSRVLFTGWLVDLEAG